MKLCGRGMSKAIDSLIAHVEGAREAGSKGAKAQARLLKDTKNIPRLVYNCELFYKRIHQLSSKTKVGILFHCICFFIRWRTETIKLSES